MSQNVFPTKGNLLSMKKSFQLSQLAYDLLDKKRNILIREMMVLIDKAADIQNEIDVTYAQAYEALQRANITIGICSSIAESIPIENGVSLDSRSVLGVAIPTVSLDPLPTKPYYPFYPTTSALDDAYLSFDKVKKLTANLAEIENSVYRLAYAIKKTQKRANGLKNIIIPRFVQNIKFITESLEEKDREEFSRLKKIKAIKLKKANNG